MQESWIMNTKYSVFFFFFFFFGGGGVRLYSLWSARGGGVIVFTFC